MLLAAGADPNKADKELGNTPLMLAATLSNVHGPEIAKLLLDNGADPSKKNKAGKSPFDVASPELKNYMRMGPSIPKDSIQDDVYKALGLQKGASDYQILGVPVTATQGEIRKAYLKKSLRWHPDKNPKQVELATAVFQLIEAAYGRLKE